MYDKYNFDICNQETKDEDEEIDKHQDEEINDPKRQKEIYNLLIQNIYGASKNVPFMIHISKTLQAYEKCQLLMDKITLPKQIYNKTTTISSSNNETKKQQQYPQPPTWNTHQRGAQHVINITLYVIIYKTHLYTYNINFIVFNIV